MTFKSVAFLVALFLRKLQKFQIMPQRVKPSRGVSTAFRRISLPCVAVALSFAAAMADSIPGFLAAAWLALSRPRTALAQTSRWLTATRRHSGLGSVSGWLAAVRPRGARAAAAGWLAAFPRPRRSQALGSGRSPLLWGCLASIAAVLAYLAYSRWAVRSSVPLRFWSRV